MRKQWTLNQIMGLVVLAAFDLAAFRLIRPMFDPHHVPDEVTRFFELVAVMLFCATPFFLVGVLFGSIAKKPAGRDDALDRAFREVL